jgi:hypothetical protein
MKEFTRLLAPERQGDSLKGGGRPGDAPVPEETENEEMSGHTVTGHGKVPGIDDPGVGGSKTNPVDPEKTPQPALDDPVPPPSPHDKDL